MKWLVEVYDTEQMETIATYHFGNNKASKAEMIEQFNIIVDEPKEGFIYFLIKKYRNGNFIVVKRSDKEVMN